jgi:cellobiose transport system permease protein
MSRMVFPASKPRNGVAVGPSRVVLHLLLMAGVVVSLFPLYWLVVMASNTTSAIYTSPPTFVVGAELLDNLQTVFTTIDFGGSLLNTVIVTLSITFAVLFFDSIAAFTFAKFRFPGRQALFVLLLVTFMLPTQLAVVPQFITMVNLGWAGQLQALIVPAAANAFGIFWLRQYISSAVPDELIDAAKIDGAGFFRSYLTVCLPLIRPGLGFLGMFTFVAAWNDYLWPLIVLTDPNDLTLQVALSQLNRAHGSDYSMVMAGALLSVLPLLIVFLIGAKQFVGDAMKGALRG